MAPEGAVRNLRDCLKLTESLSVGAEHNYRNKIGGAELHYLPLLHCIQTSDQHVWHQGEVVVDHESEMLIENGVNLMLIARWSS